MPEPLDNDTLRQAIREEMLKRMQERVSPTAQTSVKPPSPWVEPSVSPIPKDKPGFISSNLKKGYATTGQAIGGLARFLGAEELGQETSDYWKNKAAEYEKASPGMSVKDINGVGDAAKFIGEQTLQMAPLAVMTGATGGLGGIAGRALGLTGKALGGAMAGGAAVGSIGTEAGIITAEAAPGPLDRTQVMKAAIPAGLLEVVPELIGFSRTGLGGKAIKYLQAKYGAEVAEQAVEAAARGGFLKTAGRVAGDVALTGVSEGMTESAQSPLEAWGAGKQVFQDGRAFGDAPLKNTLGAFTGGLIGGENYTPEMRNEMLESMAAGAAGGMGMGMGGHALKGGLDFLANKNIPVAPQTDAAGAVTSDPNTADDLLNGGTVDERISPMTSETVSPINQAPIMSPLENLQGRIMRSEATIQPNLFEPSNPAANLAPEQAQVPTAVEPTQLLARIAQSKYESILKSLEGRSPKDVVTAYNKLKSEDDANKLIHPTDNQDTYNRKIETSKINAYVRQQLEQDYASQIPDIAKAAKERSRESIDTSTKEQPGLFPEGYDTPVGGFVEPVSMAAPATDNNGQPFNAEQKKTGKPVKLTAEDTLKTAAPAVTETDEEKNNIIDDMFGPVGKSEVIPKVDETVLPNNDLGAFDANTLPEKSAVVPKSTQGNKKKKGAVVTSDFTNNPAASPELRKRVSDLVRTLTGGKALPVYEPSALERKDLAGNPIKLSGETSFYVDRANKAIHTLITLAQNAPNIENIARHESVHVLKELGLIDDKEWNILSAKAEKWIKDYNVEKDYPNLTREEQVEEAIARAFENRAEKSSIFDKVRDFFEKLFNMVKGHGFQSVESIMTAIENGDIGSRPFIYNDSAVVDEYSKPAVISEEFLKQLNAFAQQKEDVAEGRVWNAYIPSLDNDQFFKLLKSGVDRKMLEDPRNAHMYKISHDDIRGDFMKFVNIFEPTASEGVIDGITNNLAHNGRLMAKGIPRRYNSKKTVVGVFQAMQMYRKMLHTIKEKYDRVDGSALIERPIYNQTTLPISTDPNTDKAIRTVDQLRRFYTAFNNTFSDIVTNFKSKDFQKMIEAVDKMEDLGFAPYDDGGTRKEFFNRHALIQMYTFYHYGTVSELLRPEWFIFSKRIDLNLELDRFKQYSNMHNGLANVDNISKLSGKTVADIVSSSKLINDMIKSMSGKDFLGTKSVAGGVEIPVTPTYLMRSYDNVKDFNFVTNQIVRILESLGAVRLSDTFGDKGLSKSQKESYSKAKPGEITATAFEVVDKNANLEELATLLSNDADLGSAIDEDSNISEESDTESVAESDYDDDSDIGSVDFNSDAYGMSASAQDDSDFTPGKNRTADTQGITSEQLRAAGITNRTGVYDTHITHHKDNFRIQGNPAAASAIASTDKALNVFQNLKQLKAFVDARNDYRDGKLSNEDFVKRVIVLITKGLQNQIGDVNGKIDDKVIKALESHAAAKLSDTNITDDFREDVDYSKEEQAKIMQNKAYAGALEKAQAKGVAASIFNEYMRAKEAREASSGEKNEKTTGAFFNFVENILAQDDIRSGASVPYAFALNHLSSEIFRMITNDGKKGGYSRNKGLLSMKLALITAEHIKQFNEWPYYINHDRAITSIMAKGTDVESKYGHLPINMNYATGEHEMISREEEDRIRNILYRELGYVYDENEPKAPIYAQLQQTRAEFKRKGMEKHTKLSKDVIKLRISAMIKGINSMSPLYNDDKTGMAVRGGNSLDAEQSLRYFLGRIVNGIDVAFKSSDMDAKTILAHTTLKAWAKDLMNADGKGISKEVEKSILKAIDNISGKVPFVDKFTFPKTPSISLDNFHHFKDEEGNPIAFMDDKGKPNPAMGVVLNTYIPHICRIASEIMGYDTTNLPLAGKYYQTNDGKNKLGLFLSSVEQHVDKDSYTGIKSSVSRFYSVLFNDPRLTKTDIDKTTEVIRNGFVYTYKYDSDTKETNLVKTKYKGDLPVTVKPNDGINIIGKSNITNTQTKATKGREYNKTDVNNTLVDKSRTTEDSTGDYTSADTRMEPGIGQHILQGQDALTRKADELLREEIAYALGKTPTDNFVEYFKTYMAVVVDQPIDAVVKNWINNSDDISNIKVVIENGADLAAVDMNLFNEILAGFYTNMADFMQGYKPNPKEVPTQLYRNKVTKETVFIEPSYSGTIGKEEVRFWNANDRKRERVRIMSASDFKKMFSEIDQDESKVGDTLKTSTIGDTEVKSLPPYTAQKYSQEYYDALSGVSAEIEGLMDGLFFSGDTYTLRYERSTAASAGLADWDIPTRDKGSFKEFGRTTKSDLAEIESQTNKLIASSADKRTISVKEITEALIKDSSILDEIEGKNNATAKHIGAKYVNPKMFGEVERALKKLKDAGFLAESVSSGKDEIGDKKSVTTRGRNYIITDKFYKLMKDKQARELNQRVKTKASVWQDTVAPYVAPNGTFEFKNMFQNLKKYLPAGTKDIQVFSLLRKMWSVPFFQAQRVRELMDMVVTSSRKRDFKNRSITNLTSFTKPDPNGKYKDGVMSALHALQNVSEEANKRIWNMFEYGDVMNRDVTKAELQRKFGVSDAEYEIYKDIHKSIEDNMIKPIYMEGVKSFAAKFIGRFKDDTIGDYLYNKIGVSAGSLTDKEVREIIKSSMPESITDKSWESKLVTHAIAYNKYLGSIKANIASVKNWLPRIRTIDKYEARVFDVLEGGKKSLFGVKYFPTREEAKAWADRVVRQDPELVKYRKAEGNLVSTVDATSMKTMGLFSSLDSAMEFDDLQKAFDGDLAPEFMNPAFGNGTLTDGEAGSAHTYERRNTKLIIGYDEGDVHRNYVTAVERMAMSFARLQYGLQQFGNLSAVKDLAKNGRPDLEPHVEEFYEHLRDDLKRSTHWDRLAQEYKSISTFMYMGGRIVPMIVNSFQPFTSSAPELAKIMGKDGNILDATKLIAKWIGVAGSNVVATNYSTDKNSKVSKYIHKALVDSGLVTGEKGRQAITGVHKEALEKFAKSGQLLGMNTSESFTNELDDTFFRRQNGISINQVNDEFLKGFAITEAINREGTFLAAFDHFNSIGQDFNTAYKNAEEFVLGTQYLTNRFNMPLGYKKAGVLGTLAYNLISFPFNMSNQLVTHMLNVKDGDYNSAKVLLTMAAFMFALGGSDGIPFGDLFSWLWEKFFSKTGDTKTDARTMLQNLGTPELLQSIYMYGLPAAAGVSLSANLAMNTPIIGALAEGKSPAEAVFGASYGIAKKFYGSAESILTGNASIKDSIIPILPEFVAAPARAYMDSVDIKRNGKGAKMTYKGQPVQEEMGSAVLSSLGIKTLEKAERQETLQSERTIMDKIKRWKERAIRDARVDGNYKTMQEYNRWAVTSGLGKIASPLKMSSVKDQPNKVKTQFEIMRGA